MKKERFWMNRFNVGRVGDHLITPFPGSMRFNASSAIFEISTVVIPQPTYLPIKKLWNSFKEHPWMLSGAELPPRFVETCPKEKEGKNLLLEWDPSLLEWDPCLIPKMGPFPLCDSMGMMSAAAVLDRSLDRGQTKQFVQWATFRGTRSIIANATQAGVSDLSDLVRGYKKVKCGSWVL
jgi:hypothetical protein